MCHVVGLGCCTNRYGFEERGGGGRRPASERDAWREAPCGCTGFEGGSQSRSLIRVPDAVSERSQTGHHEAATETLPDPGAGTQGPSEGITRGAIGGVDVVGAFGPFPLVNRLESLRSEKWRERLPGIPGARRHSEAIAP